MKKSHIFLQILFSMMAAGSVWAQSIEVVPQLGGTDLDFGAITQTDTISKAVDLNTVYNNGDQYEVYYELVEPLENAAGDILNSGVVTFHTVLGSNNGGILYLSNDQPVVYPGEDRMYKSDNPGNDEDFVIIYTVHGDQANAEGDFHGVIRYVVRTIAGNEEAEFFLHVYVKINIELTIEITGSDGVDLVSMNHPLPEGHLKEAEENYFTINFSGNAALKPVKISYKLILPMQSDKGYELSEEAVEYYTLGGDVSGPEGKPAALPLAVKSAIIFQSTAPGDTFQFHIEADPAMIENQWGGFYTAQIEFTIEWNGDVKTFVKDLEMELEGDFWLKVYIFPNGTVQAMDGHIWDLGTNLYAGQGSTQSVQMRIEVKNTKPDISSWQVTQSISPSTDALGNVGGLVNSFGDVIPEQIFQMRTQAWGAGNPPGQYAYYNPSSNPPCPATPADCSNVGGFCTVPLSPNDPEIFRAISQNAGGTMSALASYRLQLSGSCSAPGFRGDHGSYEVKHIFTLTQ